MNEVGKAKSFLKSFNKVSDMITSNGCARNCYNVFESYLRMVGIPDGDIKDIYEGSGFSNWQDIHIARNADKYSIPVSAVMGKISGITKAVNQVVKMHIAALENIGPKKR